jgi:hypothetical protein
MRIWLLVVSVLFLAAPALAEESARHIVRSDGWAAVPTLPSSMTKRIDDAVADYQQYAPVSRFALYDLAYPSSDGELAEMAGYGVMLVTVISQLPEEVPPQRVYATIDGAEVTLSLITGSASTPTASPAAAGVFGANLWSGLYLFPIYLTRDGGSVAIDFGANRKGFVLGRFSTDHQAHLNYGHTVTEPPTVLAPPADVLMHVIAREFPGFIAMPARSLEANGSDS